ncbi:MAG: hypothetical protein EKK37_16640 [Sphingobacteriales bacterium]|nr:MAG: hypothetical protein EKK37_16640 [Sphingobacteriales bacterium]
MSKKKIILISVLIVVAVAGLYGYREFNRKNPDLATIEATEQIHSDALIQAFKTGDKNTATRYIGKVVAVSGTVKEIINEDGVYTIAIGNDTNMDAVRCSMDSLHSKEAATLSKGLSVTLKGVCTGFNADELLGSDVVMNRCVVEKK